VKACTEETDVSFFIMTLVQTKLENANLTLHVIVCDTDLQVVLNMNLLH
jgi:hypothetical protein